MFEQRGPKIGDAASLWNFTPSPGWSKDEVQILRLSLMKFGVGKWVQILETGLLPGKLIQQLNGQTQRLLGQQSLAAYTGLQVDIDRIRADNEAKTDAPRKQGLIINTGPNLTKEMKDKLRQEAKIKYGLTSEQIREAEEQLRAIDAQFKAKSAISKFKLDPEMMNGDAEKLSKDGKLDLLHKLHATLLELKRLSDVANGEAPPPSNEPTTTAINSRQEAGPSSSSEQENKINAMEVEAKPSSIRKPASSKKPSSGGTKRKGRSTKLVSDDEDEDDMYNSDVEMGDVDAAVAAANAADVQELVAMGFSARQAKEALEETDGDIAAAAEWLVTNCL